MFQYNALTSFVGIPEFVTNTFEKIYAGSNLTRRQLLLWVAQRSRPGSTAYTLSFQFEVSGVLAPSLFDTAFNLLVQKTDALRNSCRFFRC